MFSMTGGAGLPPSSLPGTPRWPRAASVAVLTHELAQRVRAKPPARVDRIVLDMDSSKSRVHGAREGSAYNWHFESVCYHPLFLFSPSPRRYAVTGAATLRPGSRRVH
jgi:hypothetical protein